MYVYVHTCKNVYSNALPLYTVDGTEISSWDVKDIVDLIIGPQVFFRLFFYQFVMNMSRVLLLPVYC